MCNEWDGYILMFMDTKSESAMKIKLYYGDCMGILPTLKAESIDAVITDPPYGTNDGMGKVIRRGKTDVAFGVIKWDKDLPFSYLKEVYRVMKNDTWGFAFTDKKAVSLLWGKAEAAGLLPRNTFYWIKYNKAPTPRSNFKSCVETALVFTKGGTTKKWNGGGNQANYIEMPFVTGGEKVDFPTQKPVQLMGHLLNLITDPGDVVLDPFMGSGSTGVACIQEGRSFVGIEISEESFALAQERIIRAQMQPRLFTEKKPEISDPDQLSLHMGKSIDNPDQS
jgi:site-specific DNA-methyltransferase (adenine-specific)